MKIGLSNIIRGLVFFILVCEIGFLQQSMAAEKTGASPKETKIAVVDDPSYIIGLEDILEIQVWKEPDFSRQVLVRPDGKITLPLVGDLLASGMNTMDLDALLTKKLKDFIDNPEVTVIVLESHSKNFFIIGKINQPGTYPLSHNMTVLQALSVAGGFSGWAKTKKIMIIRREGDEEFQLRFNYNEFTDGENIEQNVFLKPNDTIVVP